MSFSDELKKVVKKKAAFRCCRCQSIGVEIHHIIPEKDGGLDTIGNAVPLCPNCHIDIDGDPDKRKKIKQIRDWWYEIAGNMFKRQVELDPLIEKVDSLVISVQRNEKNLAELKTILKNYTSPSRIESIVPATVVGLSTSIMNSALHNYMKDSDYKIYDRGKEAKPYNGSAPDTVYDYIIEEVEKKDSTNDTAKPHLTKNQHKKDGSEK